MLMGQKVAELEGVAKLELVSVAEDKVIDQ